MNGLLTALMTKCSGSLLSTDVGGRIYEAEAPEGAEFPYVVFQIVTSIPQDTFKNELEDTLIQFSIFSISDGLTEITGIYNHLKALFKNAVLTIAGSTNVWLEQRNLTTLMEEITTPAGTIGARHWAVDYSILVET